jgi:hypothetical protein
MLKFEKIILKDLYESINGLQSFSLYSKYKIEPDKIFLFIEKYTNKGIITYQNNKIELTKEGKTLILKQYFALKSNLGKFANIPEEFLATKIEINSPYLPNIENLSNEILKN